MDAIKFFIVLGMIAAGLGFSAAAAAERDRQVLAQAGSKDGASPQYKPPVRGAPARRVGGGTRGAEQSLPSLAVLAPDHVGHTVSMQPALYWYLSKPTAVRIELTLVDENATDPVLERTVTDASPGIHRLNLADYAVALKLGEEYQWSVSLIPDPRERSNDIVATTALRRVAIPPALQSGAAGIRREDLPALYAAEGIWFDAVAVISELIAANPADAKLREQRAALLDQAGLAEVAAYDRAQAAGSAASKK